ncbi:chaperonin 60 subunit beta 2, chloroplastic-like isoform X1 [Brassica napus]|uniref:chaperonin 60 subunit beta 2, chloroplastic-like isoform X1 n=1 Tax=Brassica napus TaxID=3708 RepID=UPI002078D970|nr:chaperonin 60 subunit beta 2, chloroplastic-like isoform X1 [Brassica napus]XP_048635847.1 chaperonin 60 subunit beta 2, chloroplastic-like isoform X1 [Brassica napus]XP_048635848.1 chaperonin 60 subunit beta 2, chloroplastic-like isoform X1 [Brassica napus]XP_048635849.1 chaperonin 60 subunit beta 2, chloroplastic-like isoform X1 [Brassica napus]
MDAFERNYRSHGVNVTSEEDYFEEPVENIGAKLARQAAAKTSDLAGHGVVLAQGFIDECVKVVADGVNPVLVSKGIDKTEKVLVYELDLMSKGRNAGNDPETGSMIAEAKRRVAKNDVLVIHEGKSAENNVYADYGNGCEYYMVNTERLLGEYHNCEVQVQDSEVAAVSNPGAVRMIAEAKSKVGKNGVVVIDEGKSAENKVYAVEGIQFDNGNDSEYFITDYERMCVEYDNCKLLLVDHKITNERELVEFMENVTRGGDPIIIIAEDIEKEPLDTLVVRKSRGKWNVASVKAPGSGELKSQYLDDIAIITGATVIREEDGLTLDKAGKEVLGNAYKVVITKEMTTIVGDGTTHEAVSKRVAEIKSLIEQAERGSEKETLNERLAKLSGGVAVIQVGGQTETERIEKKLRFEEALNGTKGSVVGGGCTLLGLAAKVDAIKDTLENEEEKVGADIVKKGLSNAGEGGSVVSEKVLRGSLEHAASAAKKFLMSGIKEREAGNPMNNISGWLLR